MTVYIVSATSRHYPYDGSVIAVFSSEEKAEALVADLNQKRSSEYRYSWAEWEVDGD